MQQINEDKTLDIWLCTSETITLRGDAIDIYIPFWHTHNVQGQNMSNITLTLDMNPCRSDTSVLLCSYDITQRGRVKTRVSRKAMCWLVTTPSRQAAAICLTSLSSLQFSTRARSSSLSPPEGITRYCPCYLPLWNRRTHKPACQSGPCCQVLGEIRARVHACNR